jgi:ribulose-bisphosphate carboxylase large chain
MTPMTPDRPATVMPVFSSGQSARQVHDTWAAIASPDLIYAAGGGIMAHRDGPAAGVRSLRDAWSAAMAGVPLALAAKESPALAAALQTFA